MKSKDIFTGLLIMLVTTLTVFLGYGRLVKKQRRVMTVPAPLPVVYTGFYGEGLPQPMFEAAASAAVDATVHITTKINQVTNDHPDDNFSATTPFDTPSFPQTGSGSGVLISEDGYIVTNNHVILGASRITVTLSNGSVVDGKLVGKDEANDLAVLKIPVRRLPFLLYGNSDLVNPGQWVMAIGYPLNLQSTVTAGIVSAKGKKLELSIRGYSNIRMQSYIQTDAVVNHGNSGGPLINTAGRLIGINAYLASPTGAYTGYSFTIPVNIVKPIVHDIIKNSLNTHK
ncbi:MAG: trypsin-like peptidase domain-containing protein [Bacteroidetes bacterium]|nr:trypsin-like peptidase domain-containing protein [Bacteroidota bacterium]